jgi:hypothetical protein
MSNTGYGIIEIESYQTSRSDYGVFTTKELNMQGAKSVVIDDLTLTSSNINGIDTIYVTIEIVDSDGFMLSSYATNNLIQQYHCKLEKEPDSPYRLRFANRELLLQRPIGTTANKIRFTFFRDIYSKIKFLWHATLRFNY